MEYYSAIKGNFAIENTWVDLEVTMLSEISQISWSHLYMEAENKLKNKQKQVHRYRPGR